LTLEGLADSAAARVRRSSAMYQKKKGLAKNGENLAKTYVIENKTVSLRWMSG
jgi:hypothetical protein